jgi:hypothetical protein
MRRNIPPALKGLITAILMIGLVLFIYYNEETTNAALQYLIYGIYAAGVIWTLFSYRNSPAFTGKFGGLFGQGFRCFIIVTICMVAFTGAFSAMHPEFAEESSKLYKEELIKSKDKTPDDIARETAEYKKQYTLRLVSVSVFGYLIIGAGVTALGSVLLTRRT